MPSNKTPIEKLTFTQMFQLRDKHEVEARGLACALLGGDPFLAAEVTRAAFRALVGRPVKSMRRLLAQERMPRRVWMEVVYACADAGEDEGIVDLGRYMWMTTYGGNRVPPKVARARAAAKARTESNVIPLRPRADGGATRRARAALDAPAVPAAPATTEAVSPATSEPEGGVTDDCNPEPVA